jgi:prepilin-type N-terminal cleavage/methylation domain-containing protein
MKNRGFTLLEILVALCIIGILVAIATPLYFDAIRQAKRNVQLENMRIIKTSLELYYLKNHSYPDGGSDPTGDAWAFTTYFFNNPQYFPEPLICPYNNRPYSVIFWQDYYTDWDSIWDWIESTNNYHIIYYRTDNPTKDYALTYYSR